MRFSLDQRKGARVRDKAWTGLSIHGTELVVGRRGIICDSVRHLPSAFAPFARRTAAQFFPKRLARSAYHWLERVCSHSAQTDLRERWSSGMR